MIASCAYSAYSAPHDDDKKIRDSYSQNTYKFLLRIT